MFILRQWLSYKAGICTRSSGIWTMGVFLVFGHSMLLGKSEASSSYPFKASPATIYILSLFSCATYEFSPSIYTTRQLYISVCYHHCDPLMQVYHWDSWYVEIVVRRIELLFLVSLTARLIFRTCTADCCEYCKGMFNPLLKCGMCMCTHCCTILIHLPKHRWV